MADPRTGTSTRATDQRGISTVSRATEDRSLRDQGAIPLTKTSMTTDAPPLEQRPQAPPKYPPIVKKVDVFRLAGSTLDPDQEMAAARQIWSQCGIEFTIASRKDYDEAETKRLLVIAPEDQKKPLSELRVVVDRDEETPSMRNLRKEWSKNKRGAYAAFFAPNVLLTTSGASSAADPGANIVYIGKSDYWTGFVLAHELGHHLISPGHYGIESPLMHPSHPGNKIVELECRAARGDIRAIHEIRRGSQK